MITDLRIGGMTCQGCVRQVHNALIGVQGVDDVTVSLTTGEAIVTWKNGPVRPAALIAAVEEEGFSAQTQEQAQKGVPTRKVQRWEWNLIVGLLGTVPLLAGEWSGFWSHESWHGWASFVVGTIVQIFVGAPFYRGAWRQGRAGHATMDTLVALGSSAAYGLSVAGLFFPAEVGHSYFGEAAAILTFISLGHWLEARTSHRAEGALRQLLQLTPPVAQRLKADGTEETVALTELGPADILMIRPGEAVATDGVVTEGESEIDESLLTGEFAPVKKTGGDRVFAGTINQSRWLKMRVTAVGEKTALARIIRVVKKAQESRADIQRLVDRISDVFVPIVMGLAVLTVVGWLIFSAVPWWEAVIPGIAVLVVACPCAMGLATPVALMAGANAMAKRGILLRDGPALEKSARITAVLFDKTGTLTLGRPTIHRIEVLGPDFGPVALALMKPSRHPLSRAIADHFAKEPSLVMTDWREAAGQGVSARWNDLEVRAGSAAWLQAGGVPQTEGGQTDEAMVGVALEGKWLGRIYLREGLKPEAAATVRRLQEKGLQVHMLSGDRPAVAHQIGAELGLPEKNIHGGIFPEGKSDLIRKLQSAGEGVAFVGDGINDGPALAQADLGIAVMQASDVAREAADLVLLHSDLQGVPQALELSAKTLRIIKQNLFWAFFYNVVAIPLAAFGLMSPVLCAAAMGLSDLFVIGNALRLLRRFSVK
jgi:P-type Cu+ transporter